MNPPSKAPPLSPPEKRFIAFASELAESFSFSGTLAQIYALLYIRKDPIPLGEISSLLGMSKGNSSVNLRILESWGAVRKAWVPGTRQDHYEPIRDLRAIALRRVEEGLSRRLNMAEERLNALSGEFAGEDRAFLRENLKNLQKEIGTAQSILKALPKLEKLRGFLT